MAWRPENYDTLKDRIHRIEIVQSSIGDYLSASPLKFSGFNLSDIFEYMNQQEYRDALLMLHKSSDPNARLIYWNMLAPREAPKDLHSKIKPLTSLSKELFEKDNAFFYSRFVIEEAIQ